MITKELIQTLEHNFDSPRYYRHETKAEYVLKNIKCILDEIPKIPTFEHFTNVTPFKVELVDHPTSGLEASKKARILDKRRRNRAIKLLKSLL